MIQFENIVIQGGRAPADSANWSPDEYERDVRVVLEKIRTRWVGRSILDQIVLPLFIVPPARLTTGDTITIGGSTGSISRSPELHAPGSDFLRTDDTVGQGTGQGGRNLVIHYAPEMFARSRPDTPPQRALAHYDAEHVLVHEMVHAADAMAGSLRLRRLEQGFDNTEEYRAIAVTNMYLSECRRLLRANHQSHHLMDGWSGKTFAAYRVMTTLSNPFGVDADRVRFERGLIGAYMRDYPALTWSLEGIPERVCEYNPFRAYRTRNYEWIPVPDAWCSQPCSQAR